MHVHPRLAQGVEQGGQQFAVVELAFTRQKKTPLETPGEGWFAFGQAWRVQALRGWQIGQRCSRALQMSPEPLGLALVLPVPNDERALLLKEDWLA